MYHAKEKKKKKPTTKAISNGGTKSKELSSIFLIQKKSKSKFTGQALNIH